ncbi:MAG TPA: sugar transferase [Gemmatimonadales bacterium]|jgi:lipopolysaccharide/colanic/teichoic acid biosynthesis glycosyltransferase|nr:sugar transferase [Gemmatimonadales bacterium]
MPHVAAPRSARASRERWLRLVEEVEEQPVPRPRAEWLSSLVNRSLALIALVVLSPVILLIALAVKLTSRGPVFYSQTRIGLDRRWNRKPAPDGVTRRSHDLGGAVFTIYKFRTMCVNAEHLSGAVWAAREDPRVTPIGRFLRQYRLDELPQLFNVLKGDMNLVGPRPERPSIFAQLRATIPQYRARQRVRPGITGLAQINQHYDRNLDDVRKKLEFDLEYLRRQSLWQDFVIMIRTVPVVLFRRGGW